MAEINGRAKKYTRADWMDFVHTGPDALAGRYLRMFWQPVSRAEDVQSGRARPIRIMSEDFTLYRGQPPLPWGEPGGEGVATGAPHLLAFRCAHRGTQLSAGWVEGDNLRCFYHGWMYDPSGQCIEQPGEWEPFCQKIRIRSVPAQEYMGLIFAYLGEGEPPPFRRIPELEAIEGLVENWREEWPINYFNRLENAPDLVHVAFVHRHHGTAVPARIEARETEFGFEARGLRASDEGLWSEPTRFHMPNMNYFVGSAKAPQFETGRRHNFMWRVPIDDESHLVFGAERIQVAGDAAERYVEWRAQVERQQEREPMEAVARKVLAGDLPNEHIHKTRQWDTSSAQDYVALLGQGTVADREHEHLGQEDAGVILLRKIWVRELRALAEGRPLKQWTQGR